MRIDAYDWAGGREAMLRFGPVDGPVVIVSPPLFEEANRTRAFVVAILRRLADRGIAGALPDLPGTGESLVATADARLENWQAAFAAACESVRRAGRPLVSLSIRGGALIEHVARIDLRWRLSPMTGDDLGRELGRLAQIADDMRYPDSPMLRRHGLGPLVPCSGDVRDVAGNRVHADLLNALAWTDASAPASLLRTVRLETDPRPADRKLPGRPLWRASEPDVDEALAILLAEDIADTIGTDAF